MNRPTATGYIDTQQLLICTLIIALLALMIHFTTLTPPPTPPDAEGPVTVILKWDAKRTVDVDLWVKAPGADPVGFAAKTGTVFNLLHDDRGYDPGADGMHWEKATALTMPPGTWVANIHYWAGDGRPIDCEIIAQARNMQTGEVKVLFRRTLRLNAVGEEKTAGRFELDATGNLVGEVTDFYTPIKSSNKR